MMLLMGVFYVDIIFLFLFETIFWLVLFLSFPFFTGIFIGLLVLFLLNESIIYGRPFRHSDSLPDTIGDITSPFEHGDNLRTRQNKLHFIHKIGPHEFILVVKLFNSLDINSYKLMQKLRVEVSVMEQLLQLQHLGCFFAAELLCGHPAWDKINYINCSTIFII